MLAYVIPFLFITKGKRKKMFLDIFIGVIFKILKSCAYVFPKAMGNSEPRNSW